MNPCPKPERGKREKKRKLKTLGKLKKDAEKLVNAFVRARDSNDGFFRCISCGEVLPVAVMNAGHYVPVSRSSRLRFDPDNINGECARDNCFDKFHLVGYRKNLIVKVGLARVEWLEAHSHDLKKWTREELQEIIDYYSEVKKP